jgi:hypothetical protein
MSYNYTLRYRTFDELLNDVLVDFQNYDLQNYIEPAQLIKVAKRVNYDLGLRIMMTKEALLDVEKGRVKLPDDFFTLNFALICDEHSVEITMPQGTHIEERPVPYRETPPVIDTCAPITVNCTKCSPSPCSCQSSCSVTPAACTNMEYNSLVPYGDYCQKPRVFVNCKNECYELVQITKTKTYTYKRLLPLRLLENNQDIECGCPNLYLNTNTQAWIKGGWLYTSFEVGKVYINYQGMMEDEDGNLLVPDHDMINEYYEYAIKQRILENLVMNDESQAGSKMQIIEARLRAARNYALSIVNTPNFSEMKRVWDANRKAQYAKYYNMFKSYPWYVYDKNPNMFVGERITQ